MRANRCSPPPAARCWGTQEIRRQRAIDALSIQLAGNVEPRLSMVFSDTHQPKHHDSLMQRFEQRYPEIELEMDGIAEEGDVIDLP